MQNSRLQGDIDDLAPALVRLARALAAGCEAEVAMQLVAATIEAAQYSTAGLVQRELRSWLYAQMVHINRLRPQDSTAGPGRKAPAPGIPPNPHQPVDIATAFTGLPLEDREVLALVVVEGLSYVEAGAVLGVTAVTVLDRIADTRRRLAEHGTKGRTPGPSRRVPYLRVVK